jgi:chromosome partitioning protein
MRSILVLNPKGGCGKSTIATNIAVYFAQKGKQVALADCDVQGSSRDWLKVRPHPRAGILGAELKANELQVPKSTEILIIDTPAATHGKELAGYVRCAQTMIMPILPSPMDIRAAERFIHELFSLKGFINRKIMIATVANRVREDTLVAAKLEYYLDKLKLPNGKQLPFITMLRASQNYIRAAERGLGISELAPSKTYYDREQWEPLLRWLNSNRSLPGQGK